jgi:hypothetical protein
MEDTTKHFKQEKLIMRACHRCGHCTEAPQEPQRCDGCGKSFLPLNYFTKIHADKQADFKGLFENSEDLSEEDLIKGLYVLW